MKKLSIPVVLTFLLLSCAPFSKESYLERYASFMQNVEQHYADYNADNWKQKDVEFAKYSRSWRAKFEDEFTWQDQITLLKYKVQYELFKTKDNPLKLLELLQNQDFQQWTDEIKKMMGDDIDQEFDKFLKESGVDIDKLNAKMDELINQFSKE